MTEKIEQEMKVWTSYYGNYDKLADNVLMTILAFIPKENRAERVLRVEKVLDALDNSISGEEMLHSLKSDISDFEHSNDEAGIALRTLQWVKDEMEKESN